MAFYKFFPCGLWPIYASCLTFDECCLVTVVRHLEFMLWQKVSVVSMVTIFEMNSKYQLESSVKTTRLIGSEISH